jgi:hypothetical protein
MKKFNAFTVNSKPEEAIPVRQELVVHHKMLAHRKRRRQSATAQATSSAA